jgi:cyclopropane-fatty-acyl-phospholipid synthase
MTLFCIDVEPEMLERVAQRFIKVGRLRVVYPGGKVGEYGDGTGPEIAVRLSGRWTLIKLALEPELMLGECYMDGTLAMERGEIYDFLELLGRNFDYDPNRLRRHSAGKRLWFWLLRQIRQINDRVTARRNVAHHYDISNELYRRFLDPDMQYSCAYFAEPNMSLEQAQANKKAHIASKLLLQPGQRVLDIGCGWGGMGLSIAERIPGGEVMGVTLSTEQLAVARERAAAKNANARFELCDYRDVQGTFDRIVSVGMFEHVGQPNYQQYFDTVARLLKDDGVAVIHAIGRKDEPGVTNPWIAKYIFPGGYIPAMSEVLPAIERANLWVTDMEILRLHYAETLRIWRERFTAQWDEIAREYDIRFCRMFEFYFAVSEIAFRYGGHMVFQVQLAKRVDAVPMTRDYIDDKGSARPARVSPVSAVRG